MKKVYVKWYGQSVEGELVENHPTGTILDKMLAVKISIQGMPAIALFMPSHVYDSEAGAIGEAEPLRQTSQPQPLSTTAHPSTTWLGIQEYKRAHWDEKHNHLAVEALDEFYTRWRNAAAAKIGYQSQPASYDPKQSHSVLSHPTKKCVAPKQLSLFD